MSPLLSIIVANYNYGRYLPQAIESVARQSCMDFELIVVDGGSTDNSVEVIEKYANGLPPNISLNDWRRQSPNHVNSQEHNDIITWWCSEKDGGQSNAFNKGFSHAKGRFLTWLNADDVMLPGVIEKFKKSLAMHPECEWFVGGVLWLDPEMRVVNCGRGRRFSEMRYQSGFVNGYGPSTFFSKRLYDIAGGVDERFHLMMDSELWLRFAKLGFRYRPCCNYAWGLRLHPGAKMSNHNFDQKGNLDLGMSVESAEMAIHKQRVARETQMMLCGFHVKRLTRFRRLLSVAWIQVTLARFDLFRWKGRLYSEVFK